MNGCWLMWLGDCCIRLCWWGLCSCWEKGTGCSAARLPATLLITGTVWDCDVFKPGERRRFSEKEPLWNNWGGASRTGGLTLCYDRQRHDEVLCLLVAVVGTVDVGQRADRREASTRTRDLDKRRTRSLEGKPFCSFGFFNKADVRI